MSEFKPPCLGYDQTHCHKEFLEVGGELPCPLWNKGECRPATSETPLAVHFECPISVLPLENPTQEELEIQKRYYNALGLRLE